MMNCGVEGPEESLGQVKTEKRQPPRDVPMLLRNKFTSTFNTKTN
jgi:hypothetical protein